MAGVAPVQARLVRRRRSTELTLIVMAAAITAVAYTLASLGANATIPARIGPFLVLVLGLIVVAHIAVRVLARGADATLLPLAVLLHGIGYVMISRLDDEFAAQQALWSLVAIGAFVATLLVIQRASDLARYKWTLFLIGAVLLLMPMVPGSAATSTARAAGSASAGSVSSQASSPSWHWRSSSPAT